MTLYRKNTSKSPVNDLSVSARNFGRFYLQHTRIAVFELKKKSNCKCDGYTRMLEINTPFNLCGKIKLHALLHIKCAKGGGKRGHNVADTLWWTQMFPCLPARAKNVSPFARPRKHHKQQCVRHKVSSARLPPP